MKSLDEILASIINEAIAMGCQGDIKSAHLPVQEEELRQYFAEETDLAERGRGPSHADENTAERFCKWALSQGKVVDEKTCLWLAGRTHAH